MSPIVLTIAGSDSSAGAGIQADIKTISALGCYAASVITALTAQNTQGVQGIYDISPKFIKQQLQSVVNDLDISAVKIGMLHNRDTIVAIAEFLQEFPFKNIVLDPVMVAKSGHHLLQSEVIALLQQTIFNHVNLLTPNVYEAEKIIATNIKTALQQEAAAVAIGQCYAINVLVKGGHIDSDQAADVLYNYESGVCYWFNETRVDTPNTHGTGCTFSSAIAAYLAQGLDLVAAISAAKKYLTNALIAGKSLAVGKGCGPVDHFYLIS